MILYQLTQELVLLEPSDCVRVARSDGDIGGIQSPGGQCASTRPVSWFCFFRAPDSLCEAA